jgi:DNA-binding NarL/FixJ family response regulator
MLSRTEKEQRVIELYQQGKTTREIAQEVHMSFGNIGSIIRKATACHHTSNIYNTYLTLHIYYMVQQNSGNIENIDDMFRFGLI